MRSEDLDLYRRAIGEELCRPCAEGDERGRCCRPGGQPCALTAHTDVLVQTITTLGPGRTPDEYSQALGRRMCPHCAQDDTGYCSLLELMIDAPDSYLLRVVDVVLEAHERAGGRA